jgi:hypothetical protein
MPLRVLVSAASSNYAKVFAYVSEENIVTLRGRGNTTHDYFLSIERELDLRSVYTALLASKNLSKPLSKSNKTFFIFDYSP